MELVFVFLILAIVFFLFDGFHVPASVSWTPIAWACVVAASFIPLWESTDVLR